MFLIFDFAWSLFILSHFVPLRGGSGVTNQFVRIFVPHFLRFLRLNGDGSGFFLFLFFVMEQSNMKSK